MNGETGDTLVVNNSDTLQAESRREFMIGRFIPFHEEEDESREAPFLQTSRQSDYYITAGRSAGHPRPTEAVSTDFSFTLLSVTFVLLAFLTVYARKNITTGLAFLSFRYKPEMLAPGTSGVFSWPPLFKNIFTVINISLFSTTSILMSGILPYEGVSTSIKLTSVIAGGFLSAILLRHLTSIIIAEITGLKTLFREYMNVIYNGWFLNALILFFLNFLILFSLTDHPLPLIISGLTATSLLLAVRALRLLSIFLNRHISLLYYILYLCALEVLPVLLIMKVLGIF
jgi:hypothetical protein